MRSRTAAAMATPILELSIFTCRQSTPILFNVQGTVSYSGTHERRTPLAHRRGAARLALLHRGRHPPRGPPRPAAPARRGHAARLLRPAGQAGRVTAPAAADDRAGQVREDHPVPALARGGAAGEERLGPSRGLPLRQARPVRHPHRRRVRGAAPDRTGPRRRRAPGGLRPAHPRTAEVPRRDHADRRRGTSAERSRSGGTVCTGRPLPVHTGGTGARAGTGAVVSGRRPAPAARPRPRRPHRTR